MTTRIGLVGTGTWARRVHAPALAAAPDVEFAGVWGRSADASRRLADEFGVPTFADPDDLAADVDVVAFAVPPRVQSELAPRAAASGCHLFLEKPVAGRIEDAEHLEAAVEVAGVRAVVFVTRLFDPVRLAWLRAVREQEPATAHAEFVSAALSLGAYRASEWRQASGALWDVGPHVLSQLEAVLGPVETVAVDEAAPRGDVRLRFEHTRGRSTAHLNLHSGVDSLVETIQFGTPAESVMSPPAGATYPESYAFALAALLRPDGDPLLLGASIGAGVATVRTLTAAQGLIESGRFGQATPVRRSV